VIPAVVTQISAQTALDERGVVAAQYTRSFSARIALRSTHRDLAFTGVYQNGVLVYVRVLTDVNDGKNASSQEIANVESHYEHPAPGDAFHAPWESRYLGEYSYRVVDATTIAFTSLVIDTSHGSGTFVIDAHDHVTSYQYRMSANWKYATSGDVSGLRAEVLPGYWAVTNQTEQYRGRYGIFTGSAHAEITQSAFQRFPSIDDAERVCVTTLPLVTLTTPFSVDTAMSRTRKGRSTPIEMSAATMLKSAATVSAAVQFPVAAVRTLASGTMSEAVPFAV
jgi:hypothetical protein